MKLKPFRPELLIEGEIPKDVTGKGKPTYSALEAVVYCADFKWRGTQACFCKAPNDVMDDWFCSEGQYRDSAKEL